MAASSQRESMLPSLPQTLLLFVAHQPPLCFTNDPNLLAPLGISVCGLEEVQETFLAPKSEITPPTHCLSHLFPDPTYTHRPTLNTLGAQQNPYTQLLSLCLQCLTSEYGEAKTLQGSGEREHKHGCGDRLFSKVAAYCHQQCRRVPIFPQPQNLLFYLSFYYHHPDGYEVVSHQDLVCISLMTKNSEHLHGYLYILFGEMSIQILCLFLN